MINAATVAVLAVLFFAVLANLKQADCFSITKVIVREKGVTSDSQLTYFRGKNIFALDLAREAERFAGYFPDYKRIRLTRFLPDCIFVDFLRRAPVALVERGGSQAKSQRAACLDENMIFFEAEADMLPPQVPVISGMEKKASSARSGRRFAPPEIALAFEVINAAGKDRTLRGFRIRRIDASSESGLSFLISMPASLIEDDWMEVRVGGEEIGVKMKVLANILAQMGSKLSTIKYIDLRFKEPVIKFKNIQKLSAPS